MVNLSMETLAFLLGVTLVSGIYAFIKGIFYFRKFLIIDKCNKIYDEIIEICAKQGDTNAQKLDFIYDNLEQLETIYRAGIIDGKRFLKDIKMIEDKLNDFRAETC